MRGDASDVGVWEAGLLNLVDNEVGRTASIYETELLRGGSLPNLPPFIFSIDWSPAVPGLSIPGKCLRLLSGLTSCWVDNGLPLCEVHTKHVLENHGTLTGNTFPLVILGNHSGPNEYHRVSEKGRFVNILCTFNRIRALGNMLAVCGVKVSLSKVVHGVETFTVAARAPFQLGWYLDHCECNVVLFLST